MSTTAMKSSTPHFVFSSPKTVFIDEDEETHFATSGKITDLFKDLQNGLRLIVAYGHFGPSAYIKEPFKLEKQVENLDVFGWEKDSPRNKTAEKCYAMVLGGERQAKGEFVFYALSEDATQMHCISTRKHEPSITESRIFVASVKTFYNRIFHDHIAHLYPAKRKVTVFDEIVSKVNFSSDKIPLPLSGVELVAAKHLDEISLDAFSDSVTKEKVIALGILLFQELRELRKDSRDGFDGMRRIAESLQFLSTDGFKRMREVQALWQGIGDDYRRFP